MVKTNIIGHLKVNIDVIVVPLCCRYRRSAEEAVWNGYVADFTLHTELRFQTAARLFPAMLPELAKLHLRVADALRTGIGADIVPKVPDTDKENLWNWTTSSDAAAIEAALQRQAEHDRAYFSFERRRVASRS